MDGENQEFCPWLAPAVGWQARLLRAQDIEEMFLVWQLLPDLGQEKTAAPASTDDYAMFPWNYLLGTVDALEGREYGNLQAQLFEFARLHRHEPPILESCGKGQLADGLAQGQSSRGRANATAQLTVAAQSHEHRARNLQLRQIRKLRHLPGLPFRRACDAQPRQVQQDSMDFLRQRELLLGFRSGSWFRLRFRHRGWLLWSCWRGSRGLL